MTFSKRIIFVSLAVVLIAGGILFLSGLGNDGELVEALEEIKVAASKGDAEGVLNFLSRDFEGGEGDYEGISARIRGYFRPGEYESIQIKDTQIDMLGEHAKTTFRVRVVRPRAFPVPFVEYQIRADWKKESEGWRIISADAKRYQNE